MICPICGTENDPGAILCDQCGAQLPSSESAEHDASPSRFVLVPASGAPPIDLGEHAVVGRMDTCDVSVPDKSVSREHARLSRLQGGYLLEDLQSTNGTLVNGYRITEATVVRPGDVVTFGTVAFRVETPWDSGATPSVETSEGTRAAQAQGSAPAWDPGLNGGSGDDEQSAALPDPGSRAREQAAGPSQVQSGVTAADGQENETGRLADEVIAITAHLSDLVQQLADAALAEPAEPQATSSGEELAAIRDVVASVPASPMTDEELEEAREILQGLAANPKDFDLLMRVREMAPQLYRVVQQYGQLQKVLGAVEDATRKESVS